MVRQSFGTLLVLLGFVVPSSDSFADHHEAGEIEAAVKLFYSQLSTSKYEQAMEHVAIGSSGYVAEGELFSIGSDQVRQGVVKGLEDGEKNGVEMKMRPKEIKVAVYGDTAIATYLIDATFKEADEDEAEEKVNRGTLVWTKKDEVWKIVHWHVSNLEPIED